MWTTSELTSGRIAVLGTVYNDRYLFDRAGGVWSAVRTRDDVVNAWTFDPRHPSAATVWATIEKHNANLVPRTEQPVPSVRSDILEIAEQAWNEGR